MPHYKRDDGEEDPSGSAVSDEGKEDPSGGAADNDGEEDQRGMYSGRKHG